MADFAAPPGLLELAPVLWQPADAAKWWLIVDIDARVLRWCWREEL